MPKNSKKIKVVKDEKINQWVEFKYLNLQRKYIQSVTIFTILNILSFSVAAAILVLNLYALKYNKIESTVPLFIGIAIVSGLVAFLSALLSFFKFKTSANKAKNKMNKIDEQIKLFKDKDDVYKNKDREHVLIANITAIYNEDNK